MPGYGALILGKNGIESNANLLLLSADKPYTKASGWGVTIAYTYTDADENRKFGEHYSLDEPDITDYPFLMSSGVSKHRLVATGILDGPWGTTWSTKLTLATPKPYFGHRVLRRRPRLPARQSTHRASRFPVRRARFSARAQSISLSTRTST